MKYIKNTILPNFRACAALLLLTLLSGSVYAQTRVTGTVRDKNKMPLPGINVLVLNKNVGTTTNVEGKYTITIPMDVERTLVFSCIGYKADTVKVGVKTRVDVILEEDSADIDEVVVVGYGNMRKSDLTGSVVSVKINENEAASVNSIDRLLQGRAAGVQVTSGNAAPGGAVDIKIRGTSSFNSSSEPLYVVDGVILNSATQDVRETFVTGVSGNAGSQASQNPLTAINPQDIASMEILKDASATAIYGSQGANGVILITTKSGTSEKPRIEYTATVQMSKRSKTIPMLDLKGYAAWRDEIGSGRIDPDTCIGVNWQDDAMRTAISQSHRLSVSGKTDKTTYYIAGGMLNNNGVVKKTNVQKADFRINLDKTLASFVKVGTKSTFAYTVNNMTQGTESTGLLESSMMKQILNAKPFLQSTNLDNADEEVIEGPRAWLREYEDNSREYRIVPLIFADFTITKWLRFKTTIGADYRRKVRVRSYGLGLFPGKQVGGKAGVATLQSFRYNVDNMFDISKTFNKVHRLNATLGVTINSTLVESAAQENQQFPTMEFGSAGMVLGTLPINEVFTEPLTTLFSALARGIYSYKDKYVLTATIRADGSSKFSKKNRYSYFPSFALAWRVTEEPWMKKQEVVSNLKLRAGWGRVGNQSISPYQTLTTYSTRYYAKPDGGVETGYRAASMANPDLKWETTEQWNVGVDLSLFNNRLNTTVDLYLKDTKDLLQKIKLPNSSGYSDMWINRGVIRNKGLEISLDGFVIDTKNFSWSLGGNISFNRNIIVDSGCELGMFGTHQWRAFLGSVVSSGTYLKKEANIFIEGKPVALFYGLQTRGIVQEGDQAPSAYGKESLPGSVYFVDQDGDNNITDNDFVIIGNPNPKFTYGFYTGFSYKNLSLDLMFNGTYGNDILNGNLVIENLAENSNQKNIRADAYYKAWRPEAPNTNYPALNQMPSTVEINDRLIEDGSFLRLANATLSYRFSFKNSKWIKGLNLSVTGRNLFVITRYSGWDPEVSSFTGNPLKVGIDWNSYPNNRAYILGVNMIF